MPSLGLFCIFAALFGQLGEGSFVGPVMVTYNVFTVIEDERFSMTCTAEHEDKRPEILWYFLNQEFKRTNLTGFTSRGKGNVATYTFSKSKATLSDSGDYYCFAKVGKNEDEQKTSVGVPIQVIKKENRPRVRVTTKRMGVKTILTCSVYPQGNGFLTWRHKGDRVKFEKLATELKLETTSSGEFQCHGNLTLGGYKYFISTAYATAAAGWSHTVTQTTFLSLILVCFVAFFNL